MTNSSSSRKQPAARPGAATAKRKAPRRSAKATPRKTAASASTPKTAEDMLRAGLKAFRLDRFMGWMPPATEKTAHGLAFPGLDSFGFRKFEDVFDQRVAGALQHLGWPDAQAVQAMQAEIAALRAEVDRLRTRRAPALAKLAARKKTTSRKNPAKPG
ncbi:MAG: poly granule associated family protein [Burkholderiaceae bacterium]|nr:MAG: poly granule associated family protein [Burkholderiaceae bacterium]